VTQRLSDLPPSGDPGDPGDPPEEPEGATDDAPVPEDDAAIEDDGSDDGSEGGSDEHIAEEPPARAPEPEPEDDDGPDLVPPTERIAFPIDLSTPPDGVADGRTVERPLPTDRIRYGVPDPEGPERPGHTDRIQYRPGALDTEPPADDDDHDDRAGDGDDTDDDEPRESGRPPGPPAPGWAPAPAPFAPGSIGGPEHARPAQRPGVDWGPSPGGQAGAPAASGTGAPGGPAIGGPAYHTTVQHQTIEQQNIAQQFVQGGHGVPRGSGGGAPGGELTGGEHGDDEITSEVQAPVQTRPPHMDDHRREQQGPQEPGRLSDRLSQPARPGRERERAVAETPALRGLPGGPGLRLDRPGRGATPADRHTPGMMNPSVWQRVNLIWREAGAAWERPRRDGQPEWQPSGEAFIAGRKRKGALPDIPRPLLITVAAVAVVVVIIAAVSLLGGGGGGPRDGRIGGARDADAAFAMPAGAKGNGVDQGIGAIARFGNRIVVSGREKGGAFDRPQFFSSSDGGATWAPGKVHGPNGGAVPPGGAPTRIVGGPGGWVALNLTNVPVWSSTDGTTWTQMPDAQAQTAFRTGDSVAALVAKTSGFLAVGSHTTGGKTTPVVWESDDGKSWTRSDDAQFDVPGGSAQKIYGLATRADVLVAGGTQTRTVTKEVTVKKGKKKKKEKKKSTVYSDGFWRSTDGGSTWQSVSVPQSGGSAGYFTGLAATKDDFYAVRPGSGGHNGVVMSSSDGQSWKHVGDVNGGKKDDLKITTMSGTNEGLAVLGTLGNGHSVGFTSPDGKNFKRLGDLGANSGRTIRGVVPVPGGMIAAGSTFGENESPYLAVAANGGRVMTTDFAKVPGATHPEHAVTDVRHSGGRYVAVGSANGDAAAWTSADGATWRPAAAAGGVFARSAAQRLSSVTPGPSGWLAVGRAGRGHPLVASSADGAKWTALDSDKAFSGADTGANAAASGPAGYAVVGSSGGDAMAWTSKDLKSWTKGSGAGLAAPKKTSQVMNDVVAGSFGFVSVGSVDATDGSQPVAWISPDGVKWTKVEMDIPESADSAELTRVAVNGNRIVAGGVAFSGATSTAMTMTSVDGGKSWQPTQPPGAASATAQVTDVTPLGKGFALLSSQGAPGDEHVRLWTSDDGTSWKARQLKGSALLGAGQQAINAAVVNGGSLVGVGSTADAQSEHVTLWRAPL
jgi:hypothetical protein